MSEHIRVGQVYFVWLKTECGYVNSPPSRVRLRSPAARTIPGHRLVEDTA